MSFLIELREVTKTYQTVGGAPFHALRGIDFALSRGEMIAIVGSSGSGKSTLMNILGFLDRCDSGHYYFAGRDVSHLSDKALSETRNRQVGFVFQSFFLLPRLNGLQNVMLPLFYREEDETLAKEKAWYMLEQVGMANFALQKPNQLSGGQQQRIAIARALVCDPDVIFADEPTGSLDSKTGMDVMNVLLNLHQKQGRTIVIVTHGKEISELCERVVTLKDGEIV